MADPRSGIICSPEEYAHSLATGGKDLRCLNRTDGIGLTLITVACLVSLVAVMYIFYRILKNLVWRIRHLSRQRFDIFQQPMDLLMFVLFFADILQAIGGVLDIRWIQLGKVETGSYCNAQGVIQSVGETAVAMTTLLIALYTFAGLWMGRMITSMLLTKLILLGIWVFIALMVIIGNTIPRNPNKDHFQAPTPYWCWIANDYMPWKILGEYVWFWLTFAALIFIYIPLFFWMRGNIVFGRTQWWKLHFQKVDRSDPVSMARRKHAFVMAAYPVVYCVNILPLSVVRWITFGGTELDPAATFAVTTIYGLSGLFNVILLLWTKPESSLFDSEVEIHIEPALPPPARTSQDVESNTQSATPTREKSVQEDDDEGYLPSR